MYRSFVSRDGEISFSVMFRTSLKLATFVKKKRSERTSFRCEYDENGFKKKGKIEHVYYYKKRNNCKIKNLDVV